MKRKQKKKEEREEYKKGKKKKKRKNLTRQLLAYQNLLNSILCHIYTYTRINPYIYATHIYVYIHTYYIYTYRNIHTYKHFILICFGYDNLVYWTLT